MRECASPRRDLAGSIHHLAIPPENGTSREGRHHSTPFAADDSVSSWMTGLSRLRYCADDMRLDSWPDHREYEHRRGERHHVERCARRISPRTMALESDRDPGADDDGASQRGGPIVSASEPREQTSRAGRCNRRKRERQDAADAAGNGTSRHRQRGNRRRSFGSCGVRNNPS